MCSQQVCRQYQMEVVDTLEGRAAVQRELDGLEKCAARNLIKFSKGKCKFQHLVGYPCTPSRLRAG